MEPIKIIRSRRKTVGLIIKPDGCLEVRTPMRFPQKEVEKILREKADWIRKQQALVKERYDGVSSAEILTQAELQQLKQQAAQRIPERVAYYARMIGVTYERITVRCQKSRWGSCSAKGNLNFNCLLMLMPSSVVDYVVVHELCHRKEMNHSAAFWSEVAKVLPNYEAQEKWLKENGNQIMLRMMKEQS